MKKKVTQNTVIFDGKGFARRWEEELKNDIDAIGGKLSLGVIVVGENPASLVYVNVKRQIAERLGVKFVTAKFQTPGNKQIENTKLTIINQIQKWNGDKKISGFLVQLPLPDQLRDLQSYLMSLIDREKDVDGLGSSAAVQPAVVRGLGEIIGQNPNIVNSKAKVTVVGSGFVAARVAEYFAKSYQLSVARKVGLRTVAGKDSQLAKYCREADVIISCVGRAGLITGGMVRQGVAVFDLGTMPVEQNHKSQISNYKLTGDVDFGTVAPRASFITPVPGGIGPVTVSALFANLLDLAKNSE